VTAVGCGPSYLLMKENEGGEILGVNEASAYYDRLGKAHSAPHGIRMREKFNKGGRAELQKKEITSSG